MEAELGTQLSDLAAFIVWPYMVIFVLLAYIVKKAFGDLLLKMTKIKWKPVYTVLILAAIVGIPYGIFTDVTWVQILVTYTLGTSFHEIILDTIIKLITKFIAKLLNGG